MEKKQINFFYVEREREREIERERESVFRRELAPNS